MKIYRVIAEPVAADAPPARAYVVAHDPDQAVMLLRKDIDFSGYRLPPAEMVVLEAPPEEVERVLGAAAGHEIGVYAFQVLGAGEAAEPGTPPAAAS